MSLINITNIVIKNQHSAFSDPFIFKVTFETLTEIKEGIYLLISYRNRMECDICRFSYG